MVLLGSMYTEAPVYERAGAVVLLGLSGSSSLVVILGKVLGMQSQLLQLAGLGQTLRAESRVW